MWTLRKKPVQYKNKINANFNREFGLYFFRTHFRLTETRLNMLKIALQMAENLEPNNDLNLR